MWMNFIGRLGCEGEERAGGERGDGMHYSR